MKTPSSYELLKKLGELDAGTFELLRELLKVPPGVLPGDTAPPLVRAKAMVTYLQQRKDGLLRLEHGLQEVARWDFRWRVWFKRYGVSVVLVVVVVCAGLAASQHERLFPPKPTAVHVPPRNETHQGHGVAVFVLAETETTVAQYESCVRDGSCKARPELPACHRQDAWPVNCVGWRDAKDYCAWVWSGGRLPSAREWEYAARANAPAAARLPFPIDQAGQYAHTARATGHAHKAQPVKALNPNAWGFYGMFGNVGEWTEDCYEETSEPCRKRIIRGGSAERRLEYAYLDAWEWDYAHVREREFIGFRCAR